MKRKILSFGAILLLLTNCSKKDSPPAPTVDFSYSAPNLHAPAKVKFTNGSTNATSYSWDFGNGNSSFNENPEYRYFNPGSYTIKLTANGAGGSNTATKTVKVETAYTQCKYSYIKIVSVASNNGGTPWDGDGTGPDMFFKIKNASGTVLFDATSSRQNDVTAVPIQWNFGSSVFNQPVASIYTIEVWDYDLSVTDQKMGTVTFSPILLQSNEDDPYPSKATATVGSTTIEIGLTW